MTKQPWLALFVLGLLLVMPVGQASEDEPDHLVSVLTSASDETQMMSLILTSRYVRDGGSAQLLLCDRAGALAVAGSNAGTRDIDPPGISPRQMLGRLIDNGVTVQVCAIFLPNRPVDTGDLRDGVTVAKPGAMVDAMQREDARLFTN